VIVTVGTPIDEFLNRISGGVDCVDAILPALADGQLGAALDVFPGTTDWLAST
jgi:hypothetical protein